MELDAEKRRELREALLSAFPSLLALERLVHDELGLHLAAIVPTPGDLTDAAFKLVEYVEAHGLAEQFVEGALRSNPSNPSLMALRGNADRDHGSVGAKRRLLVFTLLSERSDAGSVFRLYRGSLLPS